MGTVRGDSAPLCQLAGRVEPIRPANRRRMGVARGSRNHMRAFYGALESRVVDENSDVLP